MKWSFFGEISFLTCQWNLTWSWSMSQSPVMTIRFSILVSDRPPFNVWKKYNINNKPLMLWAVESFLRESENSRVHEANYLTCVCVCACAAVPWWCVWSWSYTEIQRWLSEQSSTHLAHHHHYRPTITGDKKK